MYRIKGIVHAALVFLVMVSCSHEELKLNDLEIGDAHAIELALTIKGSEESTRAALRSSETGAILRAEDTEAGDLDQAVYNDELHENVIASLAAFVFDTNDGQLIKAYSDKDLIKSDGATSLKLKVPNKEVSKLNNKSVKIVIIANAKEDITSGVTTLEQLQDKTEKYEDLNKEEKARTNFLMDGIQIATIKWGEGEKSFKLTQRIELRRALAKIRLRIDKINVKDFQNGTETPYEVVDNNIDVKLVKYTNATALIAGKLSAPQWVSETGYRKMKQRTYPDAITKEGEKSFYGAYPFYVGESVWEDNPKNETHLMVRIKLRPKGHKPEDKGQNYFYRLPINYRKEMEGISKARLHKVERNYLYDVLTTIEQLGSLDEGTPLDVESHIAIRPWPEADIIDGTITQAHYLVVKEHFPIMANVSEYQIDYISSLPVKTEIQELYYEYYDQRGDYYKVTFEPSSSGYHFWWYGRNNIYTELAKMTDSEITDRNLIRPQDKGTANGAKVTASSNYIKDGVLTVNHDVPVNFVPFKIKFKVTQDDPGNKNPLSDEVVVTQYPPLFVTGQKSPGLKGGKSDVLYTEGDREYWVPRDDVDFRFHTSYGTPAKYQGKDMWEAQRNDVNNRITVKVPNGDFNIGNPVDGYGYTRDDEQSNKMVSPEFIISSQYGMTNTLTPQRRDTSFPIEKGGFTSNFAIGYGPYRSSLFPSVAPYLDGTPSNHWYNNPDGSYLEVYVGVPIWRYYSNAEERCHEYFEGEYGRDGEYEEHYRTNINGFVKWAKRRVRKEFKYKGSWRVPTLAEVKLIDEIQDNDYSVTKNLMYGKRYWTAQRDIAYLLIDNEKLQIDPYRGNPRDATEQTDYGYRGASVRCIFDTYMHDDDKGLAKESGKK